MGYVALGRSECLEDIFIVENPSKFDPSYIKANDKALAETKKSIVLEVDFGNAIGNDDLNTS